MSRNTSNASGGNDGSWFLEAVGAAPKPPTPSEVVAELEAENTIPGEKLDAAEPAAVAGAVQVALDGDPGTSTSSFDPIPAPPPAEPAALAFDDTAALAALGDISDLEGPKPGDEPTALSADDDTQLSPALRSKRNFRWPIVVILLILIGVVIAAATLVPRYTESIAVEHRQAYYDASTDLRAYLPEAQVALDAITNPTSDDDAVSGAVPMIAELDTRAFALEEATAEPLPRLPGFIPAPALDSLEPLQDRGSALAAESSTLASDLGTGYVYRTGIPVLLTPGDLPTDATTQEVNEVSVRLAESLATDAGIVADLPDAPAFEATRALAVSTIDRYASWQQEYLDALTGEDVEAATALVAEFNALRVELNDAVVADLLAFRTTTDLGIVDLAGQLEAFMDDVAAG